MKAGDHMSPSAYAAVAFRIIKAWEAYPVTETG